MRSGDHSMTVEVGPVGERLLRGYRRSVAAVASAGNDVVVDEAMFDTGAAAEWRAALDGLAVTWVRVECALAVCEARERERPDRARLRGLAGGLFDCVHDGIDYDLVVDTTDRSPSGCARLILDHLGE